jgi:hypothetical protein
MSPEKVISFSKVTDKLQLFTNWERVGLGSYIIIDAYVPVDPTLFPKLWNDILLKDYVTALVKLQWAQNLSKFSNVSLVGGIQFDAARMMSEAREEMMIVEKKLQDQYQLPVDFMVG